MFEDDHLLVVNKPAGLNTHAPSPYAGEGLYDWLRNREPRWANLALIQRLDKETSGVIVFARSRIANRSLAEQFTNHAVRKQYVLLTDREVKEPQFRIRSCLVRAGEKYLSRPVHKGGDAAETRFEVLGRLGAGTGHTIQDSRSEIQGRSKHQDPTDKSLPGAWNLDLPRAASRTGCITVLLAEPVTGRTHQIRVQAAERGLPILGDALYGGTAARRLHLHSAALELKHPASGTQMIWRAPVDFGADARLSLRLALIEPDLTDAFRVVHGASDSWPDWYVDRLGDFLLLQSEGDLNESQSGEIDRLRGYFSARGVYQKTHRRHVRGASAAVTTSRRIAGEPSLELFRVRENGLQFELSFNEGYSVGLFLDQRDNRRRVLTGYISPEFFVIPRSAPSSDRPGRIAAGSPRLQNTRPECLNTFAYTCAFSVCAATAGARVTSVDLSGKNLEWGKRNFALNHLEPAEHEFIRGEVFDWLRRFKKKQRQFDLILLDPPTFSQSRASGVFRVEKDFERLVSTALPLLKPGGILFASSNAAFWPAEEFVQCVEAAVRDSQRKILQRHFAPQPPDFPISRAEQAYLKTLWLRIA